MPRVLAASLLSDIPEVFPYFSGWDVDRTDIGKLGSAPSGRYDAVICLHSMNLLPYFEVGAALGHCHRALSADGFLVWTAPSMIGALKNIAAGSQDMHDFARVFGAGSVSQRELHLYRSGYTAKVMARAMDASPFKPFAAFHHKQSVCAIGRKAGADVVDLAQKIFGITPE